jgi:hypothetical protein
MATINEKTFLTELFQAFPEFKEVYENNKEYHDIGIHLIFGDFRRFAEGAIEHSNNELFIRIKDFILRCYAESKDEVKNAVFVSFFENMNEKYLQYFLDNLPNDFAEEVRKFLKAFDEATAR